MGQAQQERRAVLIVEDDAEVRQVTAAQGYVEVRGPQILRRPIWEKSGHWQHFAGGMFRVDDQAPHQI